MIWVFRCSAGAQLCCCSPLAAVIIILSLKFICINLYWLQRFWFKSHLPWLISFWGSLHPPRRCQEPAAPGQPEQPPAAIWRLPAGPGQAALRDCCPEQTATSVRWAINCSNIWQLAFWWELTFGCFGPRILGSTSQRRKRDRSQLFCVARIQRSLLILFYFLLSVIFNFSYVFQMACCGLE